MKHTTWKKPSRRARTAQLIQQAYEVTAPRSTDVVIIGGGAAGLACAITLAEHGVSPCIIEQNLELGTSILPTGNGACNFSTTSLNPLGYNNQHFVEQTFGSAALQDIYAFFKRCGLLWCSKQDRLYPHSLQASSVTSVLLNTLESYEHTHICGRTVTRIDQQDTGFKISYENLWDLQTMQRTTHDRIRKTIVAQSVVIACGGKNNLPILPSQLSTTNFTPLLCPLLCADDPLFVLNGLRAQAKLSLERADKVIWQEAGEVLIRDYGISGIVSFNASRFARPQDHIVVNFLPEYTTSQAYELIYNALLSYKERACNVHNSVAVAQKTYIERDLACALSGIFAPELAQFFAKTSFINLNQKTQKSTDLNIYAESLCSLIQNYKLKFISTTQTTSAQVHRGGISSTDINPHTLEAHHIPGLYVIGEALDIDGMCGGYNLSWAWKSGMSAARSICASYKTLKEQ